MNLLNENEYNQLTANFLSPRTQRPQVGDYLIYIVPEYLLAEYPLYQDERRFSRNTVFYLYRINKVTRSSIVTAPDLPRNKYMRWQVDDDTGILCCRYPRDVLLTSPVFISSYILPLIGFQNQNYPLVTLRHRNTLECIDCGSQIQTYRLHPRPQDTLVPDQDCFNCDACYEKNWRGEN